MQKNPKILGELKIPGYSTYLHPYDATHLIGVGYDTKTNQWGRNRKCRNQGGSLRCGRCCQSKTDFHHDIRGFVGSSSDVLHNPRLFTWYAKKNLLMPATLMTSANDKVDTYRSKDAWQGTLAISIDPVNGVKEQSRITHIDRTGLDAKRTEDCKQYANIESKPMCYKLLGGGQYCPSSSNVYVPPYCYADATSGEYFANQMWNFNNDFIVRNLYLDNTLITVSNNKLQANDIAKSYEKIGSVELK